MKILAIRGKNLTSLAGEFCVDFTQEPLFSAGIFAITGETGAGKSTLLDAMCLALFAKTPRLHQASDGSVKIQDGGNGQISQDDVKGILRKGTSEGYAQVDFIAQDGASYSSKWSVRRAYGRIDGSLQDDSIELIKLENQEKFGEKKKGTLEEIERLVGLNFEQFTRSVLLAQGEFTAFMKANKNDKGALLEKLTGTEVFSLISKKIFTKWKDANDELQDVNRSLSVITLLSQEQLQAGQEQKENLERLLQETEQQKKGLENDVVWYETLARLTKLANDAAAERDLMNINYANAEGRKQYLELVNQVQSSRLLLNNKDYSMKYQLDKQKEVEDMNTAISKQKNALEVCVSEQKQKEEELNSVEQEYRTAQPLLIKARALDIQLEAKGRDLQLSISEQVDASKEMNSRIQDLESKEGEITRISQELLKLSQWKEKHKAGEALANNINTITSKLEDCTQLLVKLKSINDDLQKVEQQLSINEKSVAGQEELLETLTEPIVKKSQALQNVERQKDAVEIQAIQVRKRSIQPRIRCLSAAKDAWRLLYEKQNQQEHLTFQLQEYRSLLAQKRVSFKTEKEALSKAEFKKKQTEKILEAAKLAIAEDTEALRANLKQGEECPVCGSTQHPHVGDETRLHSVLESLQQEAEKCADSYQEVWRLNLGLEQECASIQRDIANYVKEHDSLEQQVKSLEEQWQSLEIYGECAALPAEVRTEWFLEELEKLNCEADELDLKIERYNDSVKLVEEQKKEIEGLVKRQDDCQRELLELKSSDKLLNQKLEQLQKNREDLQLKLQENRDCLDRYASKKEWFEDWQLDPVQYVSNVQNFVTKWNNNISLTGSNETKLQVLAAEIKGLKVQLEECVQRKQKAEKNLREQQEENKKLIQERNSLFGGRPIDQVENEFSEKLHLVRSNLEQFNNAVSKQKEYLSGSVGSFAQMLVDIQENKLKLNQHIQELDQWLKSHNQEAFESLDEEGLRKLLLSDQKWINKERQELENISNDLLKAKTTFEERNRALEQHKQENRPVACFDEIQLMLQKILDDFRIKKQEKEEITLLIRQDEAERHHNNWLLQERERKAKTSDQWKKISDLIGSADGNKFRLLAQEYTLDILLGYANIHLQQLNRRYRLERIPDSLALQVIDEDMGGEIRPVYSLSGGECFLASLALALGLASLSSNRLQVESLFIDEGFGSLDPETLRIAMDALERLQSQGRKVGVISHVQEMTERIPTQIAVKKLTGERSKVEVLGTMI